jgi:hypothetical protein
MRIFLEFLFGNEKMIIVSLIVILILFLFLVLVSFVKRDYIVTLRSYELFRERLDNLFLTQKNLYPFMFVLVVLSFIVFFFIIVTLIILFLASIF